MRITAAVAALALALGFAGSGCATCAMATLASFDPHGRDDGALLFAGTLIDGIAMTSLGAGALDGHSSVGWSRGEGEWAMAGGITLLVLDAVAIAILVAGDHDKPPLGPPPPGTLWVTVHVDGTPAWTIAHFEALDLGDGAPRDGLVDQPFAVAPGAYRVCVRFIHIVGGTSPWYGQTDHIACTFAAIDAAHADVTITSPR
jgi:hypothetical protein